MRMIGWREMVYLIGKKIRTTKSLMQSNFYLQEKFNSEKFKVVDKDTKYELSG